MIILRNCFKCFIVLSAISQKASHVGRGKSKNKEQRKTRNTGRQTILQEKRGKGEIKGEVEGKSVQAGGLAQSALIDYHRGIFDMLSSAS